MSLPSFYEAVHQFTQRLKGSLDLEDDPEDFIAHRRSLQTWLQEESQWVKEEREKEKKNEHIFTGIFARTGISQPNKKLLQTEAAIECVRTILEKRQVAFDPAKLEGVQLPVQVSESLKKLNGAKVPDYYGVVSGPLMENQYLRTRQDFDSCLRRGCVNQLKFTSLGSESTHVVKYQRMLLEQLFNRLFNRDSELSMVIKIEVEREGQERSIDIYCLVEDRSTRQGQVYRPLADLKMEDHTQRLFFAESEAIYVDEMSFFHAFLTQMLMLPLQTIVSDYAVEVREKGKGRLVKMHGAGGKIDLSAYVKEHPSLRNPLFFFYHFIQGYEFPTETVREGLQPRIIFGNFYQILSVIVGLLKRDFSVRAGSGRVSSLGWGEVTFAAMWQVFHELVGVPGWVEEVIAPIKPGLTLLEVSGRLYPIFNDMLKIQKENYEDYQQSLLTLPIQNYLTINVSKVTIEKYKDIFLNIHSLEFVNYAKQDIFQTVFAKTLRNYSLANVSLYQALYLLNFVAKHSSSVFTKEGWVHPSWRSKKLWKEIVQLRNKEEDDLPYLTFNLDVLAFHFDFDPIEYALQPFAALRNDEENDCLFSRIELLSDILKERYQKRREEYLSFLIEKAFKYKKYRVVEFLIRRGVHINNYEEIFASAFSFASQARQSKAQRHIERDKLKNLMKERQPEMYRRYLWEELLNVHLREHTEGEHLAVLETVRRGRFYVDRDIYAHLNSGSSMNNTLSRKDYMFSANRLIAKLDVYGAEAYVEVTEYPLLRYFYNFFLAKVGRSSLGLHFCGFFTEAGQLVQLLECVPQCFNFEKALATHSEAELKRFTHPDDIAEAILLSMMLMPTGILLRNIIVSPLGKAEEASECRGLFIVDFHDFYQKNGFESEGGSTTLRVRNSLFLLDEMGYSFSERLLKKYSALNPMEIVTGVLKESAAFVSEVNRIRPKNLKLPADQQQLYSLIFQRGFAEAVAERMLKIKRAFDKCLKAKTHIDPLELLEVLDPPLSYYYRELILSSPRLLDREKFMLDDGFKKSLIVSDRLISFLPNPYFLEQVRDAFPAHYRRFSFQGPSESLTALDAASPRLSVFWERVGDLRGYGHQTIQYFIRHVDLSGYPKQEREALVGRIQDYSKDYLSSNLTALPLSVVRVNALEGVKEKSLRFSDERLKELIFEDVRVSDGQFNALLRKYHSMRVLVLRGVGGVERIGEALISLSETLALRNLRYLAIIGCPDLTSIDLRCEELEQVTLRRNKALSQIYIYSRQFKSMDCAECAKLRLENIGIYILQRINMLICQHSCEGDVKRFEDPSYPVFLTRILRYLLNRFEESNTFKLELILTLVKLDLIDEKLFGLKGSSLNSKGLIGIVSKLGKDMLSLVQTQLFDLFLRNTLVDILNVDELLKIQSVSLKVIENYLQRVIPERAKGVRAFKKDFAGLVFKEFIKIPLLYNQHLAFVKLLVDYIEPDKTFRLHLTLSPEIAIVDYIDIVGKLNRKANLEKLQVKIEGSHIGSDFLLFLFTLDGEKNRISKLELVGCQVAVGKELKLPEQPFMRQLTLTACNITSFGFLPLFPAVQILEIANCRIEEDVVDAYQAIAQLKSLVNISLIGLKPLLKQQKLRLDSLFPVLQNLSRLQELNLSNNQMDRQELLFFSSHIHQIQIYQLTLHDFHSPSLSDEYIENFVHHEHLKIISIDFPKTGQLLESFLNSLARNRSIITANIMTEVEVKSQLFQKLKENKVLEKLHSNQPLPNWLKNHIASNPKVKSNIYEYESFEPNIASSKKEDFYRIGLSLDGGGVRGLLLATELDYLSRQVGKPLHKIFDCMGGTSIGGILALASTGSIDGCNPVCSTADLIDIFQLYGNRIFKKPQFGNLASLFQTKYDVKSFEDLLNGYFKETKLSDVLSETNVVVTAVNRLTNEDVIFRSLNAIFDRNQDFYMRDIARGTSAAPTYFPSAEIKNINATQRYSLIDGGVGLNNPSKLVIDDIIKIAQNDAHKKNYFLLSLGTGRLINEAIPSNAGIKDLAPIIDSFTESANYFIEKDLAENYKGHFLRVSPLINMHRKDGELDNTSSEILKVYRDTGLQAAEESFTNTIAFGKYKNQSLVEWLKENTDRKHQA